MARKKPNRKLATQLSIPFRITGTVAGEYFTNRANEIRRIAGALREPQAALLVYGPRRMGKSSALEAAAARVRRQGGTVIMADLSTGSNSSDLANRILLAASRELGRSWKDAAGELARRLSFSVGLRLDPATGQPVMTLEPAMRAGPPEAQRSTLGEVLDAIDALAAARKRIIGVILDEFQEIHEFGGEQAEWHLRGVMQKHKHVAYVLAGSRESLIHQMLGKNRAFYKMLQLMHFGPMPGDHFARWIDERLLAVGIRASGAGARAIELAGPRTRDVIQLARAFYDLALEDQAASVDSAFSRVIDEESNGISAQWSLLTALQQNVLRAIASDPAQLYAEATRRWFTLGPTASVVAAVEALVDKDWLAREGRAVRYDSPFARGWVIVHALPDVGLFKDKPY